MCHSPQTTFLIPPFPSLVEFLLHSSGPCLFSLLLSSLSLHPDCHLFSTLSSLQTPSASSADQPSKPPSSLSFSLPVPSTPSQPLSCNLLLPGNAHTFAGVWPQKLNFSCRESPCGLMEADNINEAIASIHN